MQTSRVLVVLGVLVVAALAAMLLLVGPSVSEPPVVERPVARVTAVERARPSSSSAHDGERPSASVVRDRRARDALRAEIVDALERRGAGPSAGAGVRPRAADPAATDVDERPAGDIVDRIGGRDRLTTAINHDFMPLASECIDAARERRPDLSGMIALDLSLLSEREHGAVVERAEPHADNQVDDAELFDCLRETALSMALPPGSVDGLDRAMLTMPMSDAGD